MNIETINNNIVITAETGYFLTNNNGVYGESIYLGANDSPENYEELPMSEYPVIEEPEEPVEPENPNTEPEQPVEPENPEIHSEQETPESLLAKAKEKKIQDIEEYDFSTNVNGFFYNGQLMWLDRVTRAVLSNTINSAELLGQETIDIWYKDIICLTLDCETAKYLLATLELYATNCYNVTANHKLAVRNMENIEDVQSYDITAGYPPRPNFSA